MPDYPITIENLVKKQKIFKPPYCPNPNCPNHINSEENFYSSYGWNKIKRFPYRHRKFKCKTCKKIFSYSYFHLDYHEKVPGYNRKIYECFVNGMSNRAIGRIIKKSEFMVRKRLEKMSRWVYLKHRKLTEHFEIDESLVYDGLENFAGTQYDPNNINHIIGKESLFSYDFNFAPMNRKGRMSDRQKEIKRRLELKHGIYPRNAIRTKTTELLKEIFPKVGWDYMILYSDRHYQYRRSLEFDLGDLPILHHTICSKIARNYKNKLFAVNNFDMQIRQFIAAFKRETISFSKNLIGMVDKFNLFMAHKNYMRPKFLKPHKDDPECNEKSPAMYLGIVDKILSFEKFFKTRITTHQVNLGKEWESYYRRVTPFTRVPIRQYNWI